MRKIMFVGRVGCGKTTLTQALSGDRITYHKTQYINNFNVIIDTPGEYAETRMLAHALAIYSFETDVIGFLLSATEPYSLYSPNITPLVNREVIGIVTKINHPDANVKQAEAWLKLTGCQTIFFVDSISGEGVADILIHLMEPGDELFAAPETESSSDMSAAPEAEPGNNVSASSETEPGSDGFSAAQ